MARRTKRHEGQPPDAEVFLVDPDGSYVPISGDVGPGAESHAAQVPAGHEVRGQAANLSARAQDAKPNAPAQAADANAPAEAANSNVPAQAANPSAPAQAANPSAPARRVDQQAPPDRNDVPPDGSRRNRRRARRRVSGRTVALAVVIGLLGGVVIGGVGLQRTPQRPDPIPLPSDVLPTSILGVARQQPPSASSDGNDATGNDAAGNDAAGSDATDGTDSEQQPSLDAMRHRIQQMYGGPGLVAMYGEQSSGPEYDLLLINGVLPRPPTASDAEIEHAEGLVFGGGVTVPGTHDTTCVASPSQDVAPEGGSGPDGWRNKVRHMRGANITCIRSEWARNFSIELTYSSREGHDPTAADEAASMAPVVDRLWSTIMG